MYGIEQGPPPNTCVYQIQGYLAQKFYELKLPLLAFFLLPFLTLIFLFGNCCWGAKEAEDDIKVYKHLIEEYARMKKQKNGPLLMEEDHPDITPNEIHVRVEWKVVIIE